MLHPKDVKATHKRNLTLSLPADLIQAAKVLAAKRGTSISSLVQESLQKIARSEEETATALRRVLSTSFAGPHSKKKWSRSELYD